MIQHMPAGKGLQALRHIVNSGARYLVATTFPVSSLPDQGHYENKGASGWFGFYLNDLSAPPFLFPPALRCVATHPELEPDLTCLYVMSDEWKEQWRARMENWRASGTVTVDAAMQTERASNLRIIRTFSAKAMKDLHHDFK